LIDARLTDDEMDSFLPLGFSDSGEQGAAFGLCRDEKEGPGVTEVTRRPGVWLILGGDLKFEWD
jgi:hypothetical protein